MKRGIHPNTNHNNEEERRAGPVVFHQNDAPLGTLTDRLIHEEGFDRDRKQPETRALALLLHHAGLSCRKTSQLVSLLADPVTHAPNGTWYRRAAHLFREAPAQRHERLVIDYRERREDQETRRNR